jgi:hypothetical protein
MHKHLDRRLLPKWAQQLTKKRTWTLSVLPADSPSVEIFGTWWDGGSKSWFRKFTLDGRPLPLDYNGAHPLHGGATERQYGTVESGTVIVEGGTFCGKPSTLTLYLRSKDILALLGLTFPEELDPSCPLGIVADWMMDHAQYQEADLLHSVLC